MPSFFSDIASGLKPKQPEWVSFDDLKFGDLHEGKLPTVFTVTLRNPNAMSVELREISMDWRCWDILIGNTQLRLNTQIKKKSMFTLTIPVTLDALALKEALKDQFLNILNDGIITLPLQLNGHVQLRKLGVSVTFPLNVKRFFPFELKKLLDRITP